VAECCTVVPHLCCGRVPRNNHSTIQDFGSVSGGRVNHNTIQRSVREGQVGYVSRGVLIDKRSNVFLIHNHPTTIVLNDDMLPHTSIPTSSKAHKTAYTPAAVNHHETFDEDPPEYLCDPITCGLINNAVITPNGDTYVYETRVAINQSRTD
jgi:hypothetical protein